MSWQSPPGERTRCLERYSFLPVRCWSVLVMSKLSLTSVKSSAGDKAATDGGTFILMFFIYSGKHSSAVLRPNSRAVLGDRANAKNTKLGKIPLAISLLTCALQLVLHMLIALHDAHRLFPFLVCKFFTDLWVRFRQTPARKDKQFYISRSW